MSEGPVTSVVAHARVLYLVVGRRQLDEPAARALMDEVLTAAAQRPHVPVVLDMGRVKFAPSVALGALVRLATSFRLDGRRIALVGVDPRVRGPIRVTQLHQLLEIYESLEAMLVHEPRP